MAVATRFEELVAWQLSAQLRDEIVALTETGRAAQDSGYKKQIRDSSASAASNLAEGFARFRPKDFKNFAIMAKGSLAETQNHLKDGRSRGYIPEGDFKRLSVLARRAAGTTTNLIKYLATCKDSPNFRPERDVTNQP